MKKGKKIEIKTRLLLNLYAQDNSIHIVLNITFIYFLFHYFLLSTGN